MKNIEESVAKTSFLSKLRVVFWPIEVSELKKFLPMTLMMFAILFNYSAARSIKDTLVVSNIGPEAISLLKLYLVLPMAVVGMLLYSKLTNMMKQEKVFYTIVLFFMAFFAIFAFVLYPHQAIVHPDPDSIAALAESFPRLKWFFLIGGQWIYAAFFVMAELWGSMALTLLFWGFANQITASTQAKRFYSMFGFFGNIGLICSGSALRVLGGMGDSQTLVQGIVGLMLICGVFVLLIFRWMQSNVVNDPNLCTQEPKIKKKKAKLSISESIKLIFSTPYIGYIAILVIAYGISINLIETIWKAKIRDVYPDVSAYAAFMGSYMQWTAYGTMVFMLVGANILRLVRWRTAALMTPIIFAITGLGFFAFVLFDDSLGTLTTAMFGMSAAMMAVIFGMVQNVLSKATKYSLFDSTKEMAYIPIDQELKTKGKAAVDVVGARLGKSGGAFIVSTLVVMFPAYTLIDFVPVLAGLFVIILFVWFFAVRSLSKEYEAARAQAES